MAIVERERLLKVLYSFNLWWTVGSVPKASTKPFKRFAYYEAIQLMCHPTIRRFVILSGPRRVGKTTILYQMIDELIHRGVPVRKILYVSFDHPILKFCSIEEILAAYEENIAGTNEQLYFFFDEVHYANEWDRWMKVIYDHRPSCRIAATGSASPVLAAQASESGVGRWTTIKVPTLSFYEYCELVKAEPLPKLPADLKPTQLGKMESLQFDHLMRSLAHLQRSFHRYLLIGGFPELALSDDAPFAQRVLREDVVDKVLKRDLTALFGVRNVTELEKLFLYLCIHSGSIIAVDVIGKEIGVARSTVNSYLSLLEAANLIYISNPVETLGKKVLKSRPKVYIADAAIRNAVLMLDDVLTDPDEMGIVAETTVYKHVAAFYRNQTRVGYFKQGGKSNKEVDIVVSYPTGRIAIEVKYREDTDMDSKEAIFELANASDTRSAIVITKRADDYGVVKRDTHVPVLKIPAFAFLYLLGHAEKQGYAALSLNDPVDD